MSTIQNSDRALIYKFLNDTLNQDEKKEFAIKQQNTQFLELLAEITVEQKGRIELKNNLKVIGKQQRDATSNKKRIVLYSVTTLAVAASLILALFIFKTENSSDLFKDNFKPFPNVYASKGIDDTESLQLKEAMQLYDQEAYKEAVEKFEKLNKNNLKGYVRLYYGISLLAINETQTSKQILKQLGSDNSAYAEGQWYLGLAYLKQDSLNKAKSALKNVKQLFGEKKREQIEKIINKIKKIE